MRMNVTMQMLTLAKSLEASPLPLLLSASSAQPALPFYDRQERDKVSKQTESGLVCGGLILLLMSVSKET